MTNAKQFQTRGVLASAYKGKRTDYKNVLTHAVEVTGQGPNDSEVGDATLCGRISLDNLADYYSGSAEERAAAPTCKTCASRLAKLKTKES